MTQRHKLQTLAAMMLACATLAGCGGGDAEAPPNGSSSPTPAPAPGPDTTAPTLTIANDVSADVATGPVTFTFVFSEDVGVTFEASDIVVTGGTASGFTRVSGTQATLVVTPTANTSGTLTVSVPAGKFADLTGNANTAGTTVSKNFDAVARVQMALPVNFDAADVAYGFIGFGGAEDSSLAADPTNSSNKVGKVVRAAGAELWAGTTITAPAQLGFKNKIPFTSTDTRMSVRVWSPDAGIPVRLKVEDHADASHSVETEATVTTAAGWQTLTFNFANQVSGTAALNTAYNYDKASIFFDFGRDKATATQKTYYFDDIAFVPGSSGGGTALISFDEATAPKLTDFGVNGAAPVIVADPAGGSNKVLKVSKFTGSEQWAGVTVSTGASDSIPAIPFSATAKTMTLRVYSPAVGVRVRLKVENAANGGITCETDALTTQAGAWETLTFNFAAPALNPPVGGGATASLDLAQTYNKVSIFSDFGLGNGGQGPLPADRVYYYDDLTFVGGSSGGGAGTATALTFSSGFAANGLTTEGGAYYGYGGSNLDNWACSNSAWCGSGNGGTGATSYFYSYYQTPSPATGLYAGAAVLGPGVASISATADTAGGVQVSGQTSLAFTFNENPEWAQTSTNNFGVLLTLGKFYNVGSSSAPAPCNIKLLSVVSPLNGGAAAAYSLPLSGFQVIQACNTGISTPAAALASAKVVAIDFQAAGGTAVLPTVANKTTGANLSVAAGGVYPTTVALTGGITFQP